MEKGISEDAFFEPQFGAGGPFTSVRAETSKGSVLDRAPGLGHSLQMR